MQEFVDRLNEWKIHEKDFQKEILMSGVEFKKSFFLRPYQVGLYGKIWRILLMF